MRFRFVLSHPESGNSLETSEFDGWKESTMRLERDENFHSLIEYFDGSFILYGNNGVVNGGIDFVKSIERDYGFDTTIIVTIDLTYDEVTFIPVFIGQYKLVDLEEMPRNKMRIPIIRDDFWAKFISRLDTPVNVKKSTNLDDTVAANTEEVNIKLSSQVIKAQFIGKYDVGYMFEDSGDDYLDNYLQFDTSSITLDEIEEKFTLPNATNIEKPVWIIEATYGGEYTFDIRFEISEASVITPPDFIDGKLDLYIQVNDGAPIAFTKTNFGGGGSAESTVYKYDGVHILQATDIVRVYGFVSVAITGGDDVYVWGESNPEVYSFFEPDIPSGVANPSYFNVVALTIFPQSNSSSFLIHDLGAAITDRIIGQNDTFYSELLGSTLTTARQYEEDGCAWTYGLVKGLQLRGYTLDEKPFFMSFNQWWRGANPILNLSLSYDDIGGQVIRVEEKAYQYDDSEGTSIDFSNIEQITRKYDNDRIFSKVEVGYERWQSEDISGIDDPQSKKTYSTRLKKSGKPVTLYSEWIAASLAIERTRRESRVKSSDYKFDNETFIVALNPNLQEESPDVSPDLLQFIPELDEDFNVVTNLLSPETRYNLKLTPARNFLRWQNYLQGGLQDYLGSEFKFASGEGNYDMTSEMDDDGCLHEGYDGEVMDEKGNIPVTDDFLHTAHLYEAEFPMEWEEYQIIRNNRRKPIGISQTSEGHVPMFIKDLQYKPAKGLATVIMWAKEYLELGIVEDTTPMRECFPSADECEDALTDEEGNILTNELGVCITE